MEAKLIKTSTDYYHLVVEKSNYYYGHTSPKFCELQNRDGSYTKKLSLKNCEAIENGYDLDELVKTKYGYEKSEMFSCFELDCKQEGFIVGAKAILEILSDKKFSEEDIRKAFGTNHLSSEHKESQWVSFIQSLQQSEWCVEIVEEDVFVHSPALSPNQKSQWEKKPLFDADGNLILKRK